MHMKTFFNAPIILPAYLRSYFVNNYSIWLEYTYVIYILIQPCATTTMTGSGRAYYDIFRENNRVVQWVFFPSNFSLYVRNLYGLFISFQYTGTYSYEPTEVHERLSFFFPNPLSDLKHYTTINIVINAWLRRQQRKKKKSRQLKVDDGLCIPNVYTHLYQIRI